MVPVFAADKAKALEGGKELFPGRRVTVVLKECEPGSSYPMPIGIAVEQLPRSRPGRPPMFLDLLAINGAYSHRCCRRFSHMGCRPYPYLAWYYQP